MYDEIISEGVCCFCEKIVDKQAFTKHLRSHLKQIEKDERTSETAFHIVAESGAYFLHLLIPATFTLDDLDAYLRNIWLECCGHLSSFTTGDWDSEIEMTKTIEDVFSEVKKLSYHYDFGTTTTLDIKAKTKYNIAADDIVLLSRNEPLRIMCDMCKRKVAAKICAIHIYEGAYFCTSCSPKHVETCEDYRDYAEMPVVNSPRVGECAYVGGVIDTERDGIYKRKKADKK